MAQCYVELPELWYSAMWNCLDYGIVLCGTAWIMIVMQNGLEYGIVKYETTWIMT